MDDVVALEPGHVIPATAAESAEGVTGAHALREKLLAKSDGRLGVTLGADAILAALAHYGSIQRIGLVTPNMPIAQTPKAVLRDAIVEVGNSEVDPIVIVGTTLPMAQVAAAAEFWIGKLVMALDTATHQHALRQCGIDGRVQGSGRLSAEF